MVWGEKKHRRGRNVTHCVARRLLEYFASCCGRLAAFLLCALIYALTGIAPAHAVSSGCLAVRGGALNITDIGGVPPVGVDLVPTFNGNFEAGETVIWTFGGNPAVQDVQINAGGALAVVGGVATFTFPTTGAFDIDESIAENGGITATLTATCTETTAEKQDAVKNAIKTLTEMQLTQSLIFQQQLLQELTGTFLTGAVTAHLIREAQQVIFNLEARRNSLERQIAAQQAIYSTHQDVVDQYEAALAKRQQALNTLDAIVAPIPNNPRWRDFATSEERQKYYKYTQAQERHRKAEKAWKDSVQHLQMLDKERWAAYGRARHTTDQSAKKRLWREHREADDRYWGYRATTWQNNRNNYLVAKNSVEADLLGAAVYNRKQAADQSLASSNQILGALQARYNSAKPIVTAKNAAIVKLRNDAAAITGEINRIRAQISGLQARVGQPPAPFAGANLQGALGLTREAGSNPYTLNPLGLKGMRDGLSFFADLNTLRRQEQIRLQQAGGTTGPQVLTEQGSANILNPTWNAWAKGDLSDFESDQAGADRDGRAYTLATGAYFAPTPRLMIGTMYRYRDSESESVAQNSDVETSGHGAGLYSTLVLTPKLSASAQLLYERSNNDVTRGGATGSFDADQYVASGTLQGTFWRGPFWLRPTAGITYAHVDSEAYTDSAGTRIPGQTTEQGQLTFGPSIGFRRWRESGAIQFIEPYLSATGIWTFKGEGDTTLASGTIIEQDDVAAQFSAGLSMLLRNNMQINLNASYAGLGESEVESWSVGGQVSMPLGGR